jgi:MPBQ/MSBQ methyltransferase
MRLIQHKQEAYWFYRFMSIVYDKYVNPFFWNPPMRSQALELAKLDYPDLKTLDVGAGTGFSTIGIVERVQPKYVTMLDQSPHQLAKAEQKSMLRECKRVLGDAEKLPFPTDYFDRYISAGSIEYWPEPQVAIAEACRVLKPDGIALIAGPLRRQSPVARSLSNILMLFPSEEDYFTWFRKAGFINITKAYVSPEWYEDRDNQFAIAIAGVKPALGESPLKNEPKEDLKAPMSLRRLLSFSYRFSMGSMVGVLFILLASINTLRKKLQNKSPS